MVKSFYLCEVCGTYHDTLENAIRCEIRRHNPDAPAPVARDQFHTIPQVAAMTGIKPSRIAMWGASARDALAYSQRTARVQGI
jgi:hypothetical protein